MNKDEQRAEKYFKYLGYESVEHEPIKNETPDFLLDNEIAVEVRRLNHNYKTGSIENFIFPLKKNLKELIEKYNNACIDFKTSAYISINLSEPKELEEKALITNRVNKVLKEHKNYITQKKDYKICDYLKICFSPTDKKETIYGYAGGHEPFHWIEEALEKNIKSSISEKSIKITENFIKYKEWWLVLVDHIEYGIDDEDYNDLLLSSISKDKFTKIITISPFNQFNAREL